MSLSDCGDHDRYYGAPYGPLWQCPFNEEYAAVLARIVALETQIAQTDALRNNECAYIVQLQKERAQGQQRIAELETERDGLRARNAELKAALQWALESGGWRLWYYADAPPDIIQTGGVGEDAKIKGSPFDVGR